MGAVIQKPGIRPRCPLREDLTASSAGNDRFPTLVSIDANGRSSRKLAAESTKDYTSAGTTRTRIIDLRYRKLGS